MEAEKDRNIPEAKGELLEGAGVVKCQSKCIDCGESLSGVELEDGFAFDEDGMERHVYNICPFCGEPDCLEVPK